MLWLLRACANELGVSLSLIKEGLEKTTTEKGRP